MALVQPPKQRLVQMITGFLKPGRRIGAPMSLSCCTLRCCCAQRCAAWRHSTFTCTHPHPCLHNLHLTQSDYRFGCKLATHVAPLPCVGLHWLSVQRMPHSWHDCPFTHRGERASRRDLRRYAYSSDMCPSTARKGAVCPRGDACSKSHNAFESWMHPEL